MKIPNVIQREVRILSEGLKGDATDCYEIYLTLS